MFAVLKQSWALMLGVMLLMLGNGMQGTLLGLRADIEGFSSFGTSLVMAGYFAGYLAGSRLTPGLIQKVGHVRVFAAAGSFISAALILYPVLPDALAWTLLRLIIGLSFAGVYVTAESWLNNAATNETRGQALSVYLLAQMIGLIAAQGLVSLYDPGGYTAFILPSVLVSLSFAPILLSTTPAPAFEATRPLRLGQLWASSPLGLVGMLAMGAVYSAQFGMASVFGVAKGLSVAETSGFIAAIYVGGLVFQYPIGWISDRIDRRFLIVAVAGFGGAAAMVGATLGNGFWALATVAMLIGGTTNPLYGLIIAHVNDFLAPEDMPSASSGLLFVNGLGAIAGPMVIGWAMHALGPGGFFVYVAALMFALAGYGLWRSTRRAAPAVDETVHFAPVLPSATPVALEIAAEVYAEAVDDAVPDADQRPAAQ